MIKDLKELLIDFKNWINSDEYRKMFRHVLAMSLLIIVMIGVLSFFLGSSTVGVKIVVMSFAGILGYSYKQYTKKVKKEEQERKNLEIKIQDKQRGIKKDIKKLKLIMSHRYSEGGFLLVPSLVEEFEELIADIRKSGVNSSEESMLKDIEEELKGTSKERDLFKIIFIASLILKDLMKLIKGKENAN